MGTLTFLLSYSFLYELVWMFCMLRSGYSQETVELPIVQILVLVARSLTEKHYFNNRG